MANRFTLIFISLSILLSSCSKSTYNLADYGVLPDKNQDSSPLFAKAVESIKEKHAGSKKKINIIMHPGRYDFYPQGATVKEYFISNHDQDNPKLVGLTFENIENINFDGSGSELIFHGRMLPISIVDATECEFRNFSIDFENSHISQIKIIANDTLNGNITFEVAPWVDYEVRDSVFVAKGDGWEHTPGGGYLLRKTLRG